MSLYTKLHALSHFADHFWSVDSAGLGHIEPGPGILAANHTDWRDILVIDSQVDRPIHWIMNQIFVNKDADSRRDFYAGWIREGAARASIPCSATVSSGLAAVIDSVVYPVLSRLDVIVPIYVDDVRNNKGALERALDRLAQGNLVAIFPAGNIVKPIDIRPFKGGVAKIADLYAERTGEPIPIYPVALKGSSDLFSVSLRAHMRVGPAVTMHPSDAQGAAWREHYAAFAKELEAKVRALYGTIC